MWQFRANVSALPTARAKCHRAAQLSVAPQAARSRWSCRQPRLRPRRHAPRKHHHNTCHRAFAHADTRRAPRWAEYCAPPRPHPPARAKENSTHRRTANLAALRALTHANCAEEVATRSPPRLLPTPMRAEEHLAGGARDAGLQTSRPRRQSARKMPRRPSLGPPHQQQVSKVQRALDATTKKPFAWVPKSALGTSLARPGAPDCLTRG